MFIFCNPTTGLVAFGVSEFLDTGHMKVVRSSPLLTGRLYPQEYPGTHFYRLSRPQGT
jgi:hypothetical protein